MKKEFLEELNAYEVCDQIQGAFVDFDEYEDFYERGAIHGVRTMLRLLEEGYTLGDFIKMIDE